MFLKKIIKRSSIYRPLRYLIIRCIVKVKDFFSPFYNACSCKFKIQSISFEDYETFFGYYDKSPINEMNSFIIFHGVTGHSTKELPDPKYPVQIFLKNTKNNKCEIVDESTAYNWQQGSRLQWLTNDQFIFNVFEEGRYQSKIYDILSKKIVKTINSPIYDCYKDEFAITLNFDRLALLRPDYGYRCRLEELSESLLENNNSDGLYHVDLSSGDEKLIISIDDIMKLHHQASMDSALHTFNHIMISPNGKKIMFLHRWFKKDGQRFDSLIVSDILGGNIKVLADDKMVSHCCWYDDEKIVGFLRDKNYGDKYYLIDLATGEKKILSDKLIPYNDGHPSFMNKFMISDSYPNEFRVKMLYLIDVKINKVSVIGKFFESDQYQGETRCDLHPKLSLDGKKVFVDSVHTGKRNLYSIELS